MIKKNTIIGVEVECLFDYYDAEELKTELQTCQGVITEHSIDSDTPAFHKGIHDGTFSDEYDHVEFKLKGTPEQIVTDLEKILNEVHLCEANGLHIHIPIRAINALEMYNIIEYLQYLNRLERRFNDNIKVIKEEYAKWGRTLDAEFLGINKTNKIKRAKQFIKDTPIAVRENFKTVEFRISGPITKAFGIFERIKQINRVLAGKQTEYTKEIEESNLPPARLNKFTSKIKTQ